MTVFVFYSPTLESLALFYLLGMTNLTLNKCLQTIQVLYDAFNKLQHQIINKSNREEPMKPDTAHQIDRSSSRSLNKTQAPMDQIFKHMPHPNSHHQVEADCLATIKKQDNEQDIGSAELWKSKYEYTRRDNQLLQSQIAYLNEHIHQLVRGRKEYECCVKKSMEGIAKSFMNQIIKSQNTMFGALDKIEQKQTKIEQFIQQVKEKLEEQYTLKSPLDDKLTVTLQNNTNTDQLFQVKLQNSKLLSRIKVLEQELEQLQDKYLANYKQNQQYLPPFQRMFSGWENEKRMILFQ